MVDSNSDLIEWLLHLSSSNSSMVDSNAVGPVEAGGESSNSSMVDSNYCPV